MKGQTPAPRVPTDRYERPQHRWVCGWAAEGNECPLGPDRAGHCRGSGDCQPKVCVEGERRGLYICGRPNEKGGPCQLGPLPDGRCGQPLCQPTRTLRGKRGVFTLWLFTATVAVLLFGLFGPRRQEFISAGDLSTPHAGLAFARMMTNLDAFRTNLVAGQALEPSKQNCQGCHRDADSFPHQWTEKALTGDQSMFAVRRLLEERTTTSIDQACQQCHRDHNFHQPNVAESRACLACHQEHMGSGHIRPTSSTQCIACHGDPERMKAAAELGESFSAEAFDYHKTDGVRWFRMPRPQAGYTQVITSFALDHPQFRVSQTDQRETNALRFNHQFHLTSGKAQLNGRSLICRDCHQPEASGAFHRPIRFEEHCQSCHKLQFDNETPDLVLPHGRASEVQSYLNSLESQYRNYLARTNIHLSAEALGEGVRRKLAGLQSQKFVSLAILKAGVFNSWTQAEGSRHNSIRYPCNYCHEVKAAGEVQFTVAPVFIPERWLVRGRFDHARHLGIDCTECHRAPQSSATSDILMPTQESCVRCHSRAGNAPHECVYCHDFHHQSIGSAGRVGQQVKGH